MSDFTLCPTAFGRWEKTVQRTHCAMGTLAGGLPWGGVNGAGAGREAGAGDPHEALKSTLKEDNCQMKTTSYEGWQDVTFPSTSPKKSSTGDSSDKATE